MQTDILLSPIKLGELEHLIDHSVEKAISRFQSTPQEPKEDYLTRQETADFLKIDLSTLYHWTKKGKLVSFGLGGRVYYRRSQVESALKPINV